MDLELNNLQRLICHKTKQTKPKSNQSKAYIYLIYLHKEDLVLNNVEWLICHKDKPNQT